MALHIHRAERADRLAEGVADLLAVRDGDPFVEELVVVPAHGVERWLTQRLSHRLGNSEGEHDGVCAGVRLVSPSSLVAEITGTTDDDPWTPDSLVWPLLETIDEAVGEDWCRTLAAHLGHGVEGHEGELRRNRRYAVARRIAGLFSSYGVQRPSLVRAWTDGEDTDGCGDKLAEDLDWQPQLWRRLLDRVDAPPPHVRHDHTLERLREHPEQFDLPGRLSLFGHTRIPVTEVELLDAMAEHRDVHLWLPHPSPELWRETERYAARGPVRRKDDEARLAAGNPLLSSLGRDARELQQTLGAVRFHDEHLTPAQDLPDTLLGLLQRDLRDDVTQVPATRDIETDDRSVQVHACHGAARQVDVLREVLVGLIADDPTLEPRDILVMCPDIETYAPLISAAFGLGDVVEAGHPAHELRVRLADRSLTRTNPLFGVAVQLLALAGGRATASEVLDLAATEPVRRRFRFSDDDLRRLRTWVEESGARWGFDADHRAPYGLDAFPQNTWRSGIDRMLLGGAMAEERGRWLHTVLPLDDVGSGDLDLAGRFAEYVDRLARAVDRLAVEQPLQSWLDRLSAGVTELATVSSGDQWQTAQLHRELGRARSEAGTRGTTSMRLADVRSLLEHRLGGRPTRANFRTGTLTVCTMVPMRSVPHRVVCLLGLDDGVFPRVGAVDGDDVLARDPMTGERDVRSEDRQLMLDAVFAATDTLVVTYTGADPHTGRPRPPAVPLGELLDALDATAGRPVRSQVLTHHPLQPFDPRNFGTADLFSFDAAAMAGARAAARPRTPEPPFLVGPLPARDREDVDLEELADFLRHPVRYFLRRRLDVARLTEEDEIGDQLSIELDNLQRWAVGDRVLADALAGGSAEECTAAEWRRGVLPPNRLGQRIMEDVVEQVRPLVNCSQPLRAQPARAVDVRIALDAERQLRGTVRQVHGDAVVHVAFSRLAPGHRLQSWLSLVALAAAHPDTTWQAHTIGRGRGKEAAHSVLHAPEPEDARRIIVELVDLLDRGRREPLPLPIKTSCAYATRLLGGSREDSALKAAASEWVQRSFPGERDDVDHLRVWGAVDLDALLEPAPEDERWGGYPSRFGELAVRLWEAMLVRERTVSA